MDQKNITQQHTYNKIKQAVDRLVAENTEYSKVEDIEGINNRIELEVEDRILVLKTTFGGFRIGFETDGVEDPIVRTKLIKTDSEEYGLKAVSYEWTEEYEAESNSVTITNYSNDHSEALQTLVEQFWKQGDIL